MKRNLIISLLASVMLSAVALYLAFRNVPLSDLLTYLGSINYYWVIPSIAIALISFGLRVVRWQIILSSSQRIGFWQAFHPLMIGFMINCILPGRVGEVARPVILRKRENFPFSAGLATVAAERVFDIGILLSLFVVVLATVPIQPDLFISFGKYRLNRETLEMISNGMLKLCVVLIAGIVMVTMEKTRNLINRLIIKTPGLFVFISKKGRSNICRAVSMPLVGIVDNFAKGFSLVRYPKKLISCILLSIGVWYLAALSIYVMALGCPGVDGLSFLELAAVFVIICFFIAIPSVPGFWGVWEAGGVFALSLFGVSARDAAGFTLANHAVQMIPVIMIGIVSAIITGINILKVAYEKDVP
jgi:glycosyltransferase 2 family protein